MSSTLKLSRIPVGKKYRIEALENRDAVRARLTDLGFYTGETVELLFRAISGDPAAYLVENSVIALRSCESDKIMVIPL